MHCIVLCILVLSPRHKEQQRNICE